MKTTTMCLLSGFFGALFAVACGVVDGVGDSAANADDVTLRKEVIERSYEEWNSLVTPWSRENWAPLPSDVDFEDNPVWSHHFKCVDGNVGFEMTCAESDITMVWVVIY